jgi:hypothetical protein
MYGYANADIPLDCDLLVGALSLPLLRRYSNLSLVIQGRRTVIDQAREYWNARFPAGIAESRVAFQVSDFFVWPENVRCVPLKVHHG